MDRFLGFIMMAASSIAMVGCGSSGSDADSGGSGAGTGIGGGGDSGAGSGGNGAGTGDGAGTGNGAGTGVGGGTGIGGGGTSSLDTDTGCSGVFNPDQVLEYAITMAPDDYDAILADTTFSLSLPGEFSCNGGAPMQVAIERKRSGGATKVGLKVELDSTVAGQSFYGLKKLGFDNGTSSGSNQDDATPRDVIAEYLGWRFMRAAGVMASRSALAKISINGGPAMVYVHVEQVDKRFLQDRLGENGGWLYKKSGGDGDGLKTHENDGVENPHEAWYCFLQKGGCASPDAATLAEQLPTRADIPQMHRLGAVNAIIGNTDGLLYKDNNYYHYDSIDGKRTYIPWDLDTTMSASVDIINDSVPGGTTVFTDAFFSHWEADYLAIVQQVLDEKITASFVEAELNRVLSVAAAAIDADPALADGAADAVSTLSAWWQKRLPELQQQLK
ncbi:CotH kinase family protein [Sorangium sp. So ce1078]|uniref:CotH kinase family protein n=1 Tax=Sorangium sp. So ce1078 TaxID=3133329 RepID=UPI003F634A56